MSRYENGQSLTRGEFVAHAKRWDEALERIEHRLDTIDERLNRNKRMFMGMVSTTVGRALFVGIGVGLSFLAARYGVPF